MYALSHQMRHLFKMSNPYSSRIRPLLLVNTKEEIKQSEKKYNNNNNNNNNNSNNNFYHNTNNNLIISSAIIYTGINNKTMFKIESLKVCCPFAHSHYNKIMVIMIKF